MKNKRIFAVIIAKDQHKYLSIRGIFCALTAGVYHCICALIYRLSLSQWSHYTAVFGLVFGEIKESVSLSYIHTPNTYTLCQRPKVSGPQRITVPAILRQQRDSLHRILNSHSRVCHRTATQPTSPPHLQCTNSFLVPNGSVSRISATGGSSSPSKPPE